MPVPPIEVSFPDAAPPPINLPDLPAPDFPDVEVASHPALPSLTAFPSFLVDRYAGSYRLSWQPRSDQRFSMLRHDHIYPIYTKDFPADAFVALKREGYTDESLKESMIWNGDCVLCYQPMRAYKLMVDRLAEINRKRSDGGARAEAFDAELQELARLTGKATGKSLVALTPDSTRSINDHVDVSKTLRNPGSQSAG